MPNQTYATTLDLSFGAYHYAEGRVQGSPELSGSVLDLALWTHNTQLIIEWTEGIASGRLTLGELPPGSGAYTPGYKDEITPVDRNVKWELEIGDLTWTAVWSPGSGEVTLSRSAFDLSWRDYVYFMTRLGQFNRMNVGGNPRG